jgi:hypothetical protein
MEAAQAETIAGEEQAVCPSPAMVPMLKKRNLMRNGKNRPRML